MSVSLRRIVSFLACSLGMFVAANTAAQDYPTKPIRLIVANSAGVPVDTIARIVSPEMSKFLGQPFVVENKPGAGQMIGYEYVAKQAPADGYTMVLVSVPVLATMPVERENLRFDPLKDLPPFVGLVEQRNVFGSSSKEPWTTFNELVANAKANPGKLNYGAASLLNRLIAEVLIRDLRLDVVYIPYSAAGPYVLALVSGEMHMGVAGETVVVPFGDKFKVLAVSGKERSTAYPNAPTFAELGYPQIPGLSYSLNVRGGTPSVIVDKLYAAASKAMQHSEVRAQFARLQYSIANETPEAAAKNLAEQVRLFSDIAKKIGIKPI